MSGGIFLVFRCFFSLLMAYLRCLWSWNVSRTEKSGRFRKESTASLYL